MMKLVPSTWNGNDISDATYTAKFTTESGLDEFAGVETLISDSLVGRPSYQGRTFVERRITMRVRINTKTQANYEQLMKWFDPAGDEAALVATADDATSRTLTAKVESRRVVDGADWVWEFTLVTADGRWKKAATPVAWTVASSGSTQAVTNGGTTRVYPKIKVKAAVAKTAANGWTHRRYMHMANRTGAPLTSPMGALGYPIMLSDGTINFTAKAVAAFEDIRVFLDGKEWQRFLSGSIGAIKVWAPIQYGPARGARFNITAANFPNNRTEIASIQAFTSLVDWPETGYVIFDSEVVYYERHDDYFIYDVHRGMFNSTVAAHSTSSGTYYVMEHVVELWYNYSGVTVGSDAPYEISDLVGNDTPLEMSTSTNTLHNFVGYWARSTRYPRQWVPELREENSFDVELSFEDTANSIEIRDTPGRFKKNAMVIDCPIPIDTSAGAVEHDITVPITLCLKCIGQDVAGNDIDLVTYYKSSSGTNVTLTPTARLTQFRYEAHNQIVTGGVGTGTDTLVTSAAPYGQTFTLDEDTTIRALFYRHKRASGTDTLALDLYAVNDDDAESVDTVTKLMPTAAPSTYSTSYVDETVSLATPIALAAGTYALVWTCSSTTGVNIDSSDGSTYSGGEMRSGGVQSTTISTSYDVQVSTADAKLTTDPIDVNATGAGSPFRAGLKFLVPGTWPDAPTISAVTLRLNIETETSASIYDVWGPYVGSTLPGQLDVETETTGLYANLINGVQYFNNKTVAVGTLDILLGSSVATDLGNAFSDVGYFALGVNNDNAGGESAFSAIADAANPEAKLVVSYTDAAATAFSTVIGRDAYFLILGDAENAPQGDAPAGQALEVIVDNTSFTYQSASVPDFESAAEETTGVVLLYAARLQNDTTGQYVDIKIPCTVGDEFEIDCGAKTVKRTIIGGTNIENGIVGDHVPWACSFSDEEEWFRLDPGSNTFSYTEVGMAASGVVVTFTFDDAWS